MKKAADQGLGNAETNLGVIYLKDGNTEKGEKLLRSAVNKHDRNWEYANIELGRALMAHSDRAAKEEGLSLVKLAAEAGREDAFRLLCQVYHFGYNGEIKDCMKDFIDHQQGIEWQLRGAEKGEPLCQALTAMTMINGEGQTHEQLQVALEMAKRSADQNDSYGCYICGCILEKLEKYQEALTYYEKAVSLGDSAAEEGVQRMKEKLK